MAAHAAPASPLQRGSERGASDLGRAFCGGRRGRVDRAPSVTTSHRGAGAVHAEPFRLDTQWSSSRSSAAGAGVQASRPQYADTGTSPFADQEVDALVSRLQQQMEETRAANSKISIERDEAVARNACLTQMVND